MAVRPTQIFVGETARTRFLYGLWPSMAAVIFQLSSEPGDIFADSPAKVGMKPLSPCRPKEQIWKAEDESPRALFI